MLRFVREKTPETVPEKPHRYSLAIESGEVARKTYENIIETPSTSSTTKTEINKIRRKQKNQKTNKKVVIPFSENQLFRAATSGDMDTIQQMNLNNRNVNVIDQYGWSALMMAAFEGHLDVIKMLVRAGARADIESHKGDTALSLAQQSKHKLVGNFLEQILAPAEPICLSSDDDSDNHKESNEDESFFCDICNAEFPTRYQKSHATSTIHRFNRNDSQKSARHFGIPESNVGFQMLLNQGWDRERGLGPEQDGVIYPIKTTLRKPRSGLGTRQPTKPRVTHFKPFDCNAIQSAKPQSISNVKTRRQIKAEKLRTQRKDRYLRKILS